MKTKTIAQEAAACRKAFKGVAVGSLVQHCHHKQWIEILEEPAENRILFILNNKAESERAARLRMFRPFDASHLAKMPKEIQKAYADWQKADADRQKADADRQKAYADWQKAYADWQKAYADWQKAYADRQKAYADRQKAVADWQKAYAGKALQKLHAETCGCPWNATLDIFGNAR